MATESVELQVQAQIRSEIAPPAELLLKSPDDILGTRRFNPTRGTTSPYLGKTEGGTGPMGGRGGRRRAIAVVEDEEDLLSIYSTYLKSQGYDLVFTFANGEEFVRAVEEGNISPDLVLMDYRLPGKNGIEIGIGVTAIRPDIKVIVTTADDSIRNEVDTLGFRFLLKPFSLLALSQTMDVLWS